MGWESATMEERRREFAGQALQPGANLSALYRRYGISRPTGVRWRDRAAAGETTFTDRSHRPQQSPRQTPAAVEERVLALRDAHPTWGGTKLRRTLLIQGMDDVPAASTITAILRRHDRIDPAASLAHRPVHRLEAAAPNDLVQLDFTGHFPVGRGRCHPLPVLDDHSRFLLGLWACADEQGTTVRPLLTELFRHYGLPQRMLCDNGPPWGTRQSGPQLTVLTVWLLRLGIEVIHGRPRHPQTQGKLERLNKTLIADVIQGRTFASLAEVQLAFDRYRAEYNSVRPHQALDLATPSSRYTLSPRPFVEELRPLVYAPDDLLRKVDAAGRIGWEGRSWPISDALAGEWVAVRPTAEDGVADVRFGRQVVRVLCCADRAPRRRSPRTPEPHLV